VSRFEDESERSLELLDNSLDELGKVETLVRLAVPDVFTQSRDDFGISVRVEHVTSLVQDVLELFVVGDDTVVDQAELGHGVAHVGVTVERRRDTVRRPSRVGHRGLRDEDLAHVNLLGSIALGAWDRVRDTLCNVLAESSNLADFLEEDDRSSRGIAINSDTCEPSIWTI